MINHDSIIGYLNGLKPEGALAQAAVVEEVRAHMQVLIDFSERMNAPRKVILLKEETSRLKAEVAQLQEAIGQMDQEHTEQRANMETLGKLRAEHAILCDLEKQRNEIQELEKLLSGQDLTELKNEIGAIQQSKQGDLTRLNNWLTDADGFFSHLHSHFLEQTKILWSGIQEKRSRIQTDLQGTTVHIRDEHSYLSELLNQYQNELVLANGEYDAVFFQLTEIKEKLRDIRERHGKNLAAYNLHFAHNQAIYGALGKRHQLDSHLRSMFDQIQEKLNRFDQEIKTLVEKTDHMTIF